MFHFKRLRLENFRCFDALDMALEDDLTILFAENGGGKTALLSSLAMGLAAFQPGSPKEARPSAQRDPRMITLEKQGKREAAGSCTIVWTAEVRGVGAVEWSTTLNPASGRASKRHGAVMGAIERTRIAGQHWPLFAWYGTNRLGLGLRRGNRARSTGDRWDGYVNALNPSLTDGPLLQWLTDEFLSDAVRHRAGEPERFLDAAVAQAMVRATRGVEAVWYEPRESAPSVRFEKNGHVALWSELSDGYHSFLALVADIARRSVMLNEGDGGDAPERAEGVVLIDEIDLHLHPRWQRVVIDGLRRAFPRLQFIVTTHSPQVLSSALNRQVRLLIDGRIQTHDVYVEGRDSNAILRELMATDDRDEEGTDELRRLYGAIDAGRKDDAEKIYGDLLRRWGDRDPALIRARGFMDWED